MRKFHLWMIESELEQAVGRARLLRNDCTVNLFSNFPIKQAVMKETDYYILQNPLDIFFKREKSRKPRFDAIPKEASRNREKKINYLSAKRK